MGRILVMVEGDDTLLPTMAITTVKVQGGTKISS